MSDRREIWAIALVLLFGMAFSVAQLYSISAEMKYANENAPARFVISSWSYPDDYGQGVHLISIYENSTGSWVQVDDHFYYDVSTIYDWNHSVGMKLYAFSWFNGTLAEETNTTLAQSLQRHNLTVTDAFGTVVYSQENFTYFGVSDAYSPMLYYSYEHELDWLPNASQQYYITLTYEIYYRE